MLYFCGARIAASSGFVPSAELHDKYANADLLVVSSRFEAGPLVALEAGLRGAPLNVDDQRGILPPKSRAMSDMESMIHHFKQVMEGPRPPAGECYVAVESPKGEKGYYLVSDGTSKPVRWRIRPPSFVNLSAIPKMVEGHLLSDVIAINASIDIVMGEIDR